MASEFGPGVGGWGVRDGRGGCRVGVGIARWACGHFQSYKKLLLKGLRQSADPVLNSSGIEIEDIGRHLLRIVFFEHIENRGGAQSISGLKRRY